MISSCVIVTFFICCSVISLLSHTFWMSHDLHDARLAGLDEAVAELR
jgi:hypothetical protein